MERHYFLLTVLVILAYVRRANSYKCSSIKAGCACRTESGHVIDLDGIRIDNVISGDYQYSYSPCGNLPCGSTAPQLKSVMCQEKPGTTEAYLVGVLPPNSIDSIEHGFRIQYAPAPDGGRLSAVDVLCGEQDAQLVATGEQPTGHYKFELKTKRACIDEPESKKKRLSGGSILLIIALCLVVVYLTAGLLVNKFVYKAQGMEVIPNVSFWSDLPFLIRDGCVFTVRKCKREDNYQSI